VSRDRPRVPWSGTFSWWLAAFSIVGIATLAWFGYRATAEWQRSSVLLVERRADELAGTLVAALTRDMRAVQTGLLDGRDWDANSAMSPFDVIDTISATFARYPYPEAFFAWSTEGRVNVFFGRAERLPSWLTSTGSREYPTEVVVNPEVAAAVLTRIEQDTMERRTYSIFEMSIAGVPYQVVARPSYGRTGTTNGGFAVLVNLSWVRTNYFSVITNQVSRIGSLGGGLIATIVDESGDTLPGFQSPREAPPQVARRFTVAFFDPSITALKHEGDLPLRVWTVHVNGATDPTLALAARGARRTLLVIAAGAVALALGLFFSGRAARAMTQVNELRSDFVSTVTHELKTPVQVIRSIGETLARGRVTDRERLREYAQLLVQEGHRLSRLIDNLLAYSRVTDVTQLYSFEPLQPAAIVDEALHGFHRLITEQGFHTEVDVPQTLPAVRADRTSIVLALDNLIDNAMRYSGASRQLAIHGEAREGTVEIAIRDCGIGIDPEELTRVTGRFIRGRSAPGAGSGLGLSIVSQIVKDHGGALRLESVKGTGTTAVIVLPAVNPRIVNGDSRFTIHDCG
jgi:signal transduction histidine kinase